jgi:hypothetical protein
MSDSVKKWHEMMKENENIIEVTPYFYNNSTINDININYVWQRKNQK